MTIEWYRVITPPGVMPTLTAQSSLVASNPLTSPLRLKGHFVWINLLVFPRHAGIFVLFGF